MKAIILAAGYGTRLGALGKYTAKPLLEIGEKPLIEHIVEKVQNLPDVSDIYVITNDKFYPQFVQWSVTMRKQNLHILNDMTTSHENRRGCVGDIAFAIADKNIDDDLLVIGGDNFFDDQLHDFLAFFRRKGSSILVHDVNSYELARQFGTVLVDGQSRITTFVEKSATPVSTLASTLIYALHKDHLPLLQRAAREGKADNAGDFIKYLAEHDSVFAKPLQGQWYDVGTHQQLEKAKEKSMNTSISIFGTGYVGLVTGACLANLGHNVVCVDVDQEKIKMILSGKIMFYEPGLVELVNKNREKGRLHFTTNAQEAVESSTIIFNCVGTPGREDGSADLQHVLDVAKIVALYGKGMKVLVNKSTVPPGTAQRCFEVIREQNLSSDVLVVSNPEFLAEGKAIYDFTHPDKIVVGAHDAKAFALLRRVYTGRIRTYIPFLETDWETAEMIKYANNSFLATKISFINEIANLCDKTGADVRLVAQAMGLDYRINPKFLNPGVGYGGSCFPKDVRALIAVAKEHGYDAPVLRAVDALNESQKKIMVAKVKEHFGQTLAGRTLSVWGLSFKPQTSDMRDAPAVVIIQQLLQENVHVVAYDPVAMDEARQIFGSRIAYASSPEESVAGSSGIIVATEWDEFRNADFSSLEGMEEKVIFDGRNIYEPGFLREEGFTYYGVGRR